MIEFLSRLVRLRWFIALVALLAFCWGFSAEAQVNTTRLDGKFPGGPQNFIPSNCDSRTALCDEGEAWYRVQEYRTFIAKQYPQYRVVVGMGADEMGWYYFRPAFYDANNEPVTGAGEMWSRFQNLCLSRPRAPGWSFDPDMIEGPKCWHGCGYAEVVEGNTAIALTPTGGTCLVQRADGSLVDSYGIKQGVRELEDPCVADPNAAGCPPVDPGDGGTDPGDGGTDPGGGGTDPGGGFFPGSGGNPGGGDTPGGGGPWGPGDGGGTPGEGEGQGQLCGGPNQVPCTMTLGTATLPTSCNQPPTCTGDPIACGILYTTWRTACNGEKKSDQEPGEESGQPDWTKVTGDGTDGLDADPDSPLRTLTLNPGSRLDQSGFSGGGSCPSLGTINFKVGTLGKVVNFDALNWWCPMLGWVRGFMHLLGVFVGVGILVGGKF